MEDFAYLTFSISVTHQVMIQGFLYYSCLLDLVA